MSLLTGTLSNLLKSRGMEGGASGRYPLAHGALSLASTSVGRRTFGVPAPLSAVPAQQHTALLYRRSAPASQLGPALQVCMQACGALWWSSADVPRAHSSPCDAIGYERPSPVVPAEVVWLVYTEVLAEAPMQSAIFGQMVLPRISLCMAEWARSTRVQPPPPLVLSQPPLMPAHRPSFYLWTRVGLSWWLQQEGEGAMLGAATRSQPQPKHLPEPFRPALPHPSGSYGWAAIPACIAVLLTSLLKAVSTRGARVSTMAGMHRWCLLAGLALLAGTATASPLGSAPDTEALWLELAVALAKLTAVEGIPRVVQRVGSLICWPAAMYMLPGPKVPESQPAAMTMPPGLEVPDARVTPPVTATAPPTWVSPPGQHSTREIRHTPLLTLISSEPSVQLVQPRVRSALQAKQPQPPPGARQRPPLGARQPPPPPGTRQPPLSAATQPPLSAARQPPLSAATQPPLSAARQPPLSAV